jgi:hypothetical protein
MIFACLKSDARPNMTSIAALFEGCKATYYEETISVKRTWHNNKGRSSYADKNTTHGGDR